MNNTGKYDISIIVATHGRAQAVMNTIHSLARQQGLKGKTYEIIIVDNNTSNITYRNVKSFIAEHEEELGHFNATLSIVREPRKGLSFARNTGIRTAQSPIIIFTDDDIIVDSYWVSTILETFEDVEVLGVFGYTRGATDDYFISTKTDTHIGNYRDTSKLWDMGHGNNMAFRRSVLLEIGLFDEKLGAGSEYQAAEDTDLFYRILKNGGLLRYQPGARAVHYGHLHEEDPIRKVQQYDIGAAAFAAKYLAQGDPLPLKLALKRLKPRWEIIRPYLPFSPVALIKDQHRTLMGLEYQFVMFVKRIVTDFRSRKNGDSNLN